MLDNIIEQRDNKELRKKGEAAEEATRLISRGL